MLTHEKTSTAGLTPADRLPRRVSNISQALRAIDREPLESDAAAHKVVVRPVRSSLELEEVYRLTHDAYVERNYCTPQPDGKLIHYPHLENIPETTVLVALQDGKVMGTVSLTLDGPQGIHADLDFADVARLARSEGRKLGAAWRMATRQTLRGERQVVMALIGEVVSYAFEVFDLDTFLCTFNPRHERIYGRLLGMRTIARNETSEGLENAPAVLMRCDREMVPEKWLKRTLAGQDLSLCASR
ncbi:MAG: hypothetical protein L6R28_16690 [Planctomycetes bacterium]|nr:hypothetical protein [Planctomycetota bacterium]